MLSTPMDNRWIKILDNYDEHCLQVYKDSAVNSEETPDLKSKRIARLEKDYISWFEYYFPKYAKKKSAWFHKKLSKLIISNKKIRLLAEIYRSGGKSVHVDMGIPLYMYLALGELKFMLLIGETAPKACKLLSGIQAELEFNQRLINDYGRKHKQGDWSEGDFYTTDGIRFMSIGFQQSPRGAREGAERPDYIVIDDVDTKQHVNNDRIMSEGVEYIIEDVEGTFDTDSDSEATERLIFANNNFHKNSITNRLKAEFEKNILSDKEEGIQSDYHIFTVPAVKELATFTPNWPEKTNAQYWRTKFKRNPRAFLRNYQHTHASDGKMFKPEMMQWSKMLPLKQYEALVVYGDLSYKDQADYKAMILCGKTGREFHVLYTLCRQTSRTEAAKWLYDLYEDAKLDNLNITYKIEGLFAMDEFVSEFDAEGDERNYHIPVIADKRGKANKFDRIESILGFFIRRWVFFNENEKKKNDQITLIDQLYGFEKGSGVHDDGPDCLHGCFDLLNKEQYVENFSPRFTKRLYKNKRF